MRWKDVTLLRERGTLGVVWGCEPFQLILLGVNFELFINHKALLQIFSRTLMPPAWFER